MSGRLDDLSEVRRADFFLAFGDENQIHGQLAAGGFEGVQRGEPGGFGSFLIDGSAADQNFSEAGLVDQRGFKRRRGPLGRVGLLHVVHEIDADGFGRAGVERGEDSGMAVGRDFGHLVEAGVAQHAHHHVAAFGHAAIFGGDGGLANPVLQPVDGFVVMLVDFGLNGLQIGGSAAEARRERARSRPRPGRYVETGADLRDLSS